MGLDQKYKTLITSYGINTPLRLAHFMAQIEHESGLKPISENLNYSKAGLRKVFSKYFNSDEDAQNYARKPEKIANRVYADRMGNGDEKSGEGWKYRGRGFIQITGKSNYFRLHIDTDLDCVKNPDLLLEEVNAMISACWYWRLAKCNVSADLNDIEGVTRRINGGLNGITHRKELFKKWHVICKGI